MCGRYWIDETEETRAIAEEMERSALTARWRERPGAAAAGASASAGERPAAGVTAFGEIFPTYVVPVIASDRSGDRAVFPMKWGYSAGRSAGGPSGGNGRGSRSLLINARAETAAEKRTFREDWK